MNTTTSTGIAHALRTVTRTAAGLAVVAGLLITGISTASANCVGGGRTSGVGSAGGRTNGRSGGNGISGNRGGGLTTYGRMSSGSTSGRNATPNGRFAGGMGATGSGSGTGSLMGKGGSGAGSSGGRSRMGGGGSGMGKGVGGIGGGGSRMGGGSGMGKGGSGTRGGAFSGLPGKYVMTLEGGGFWPGFSMGGYMWLPASAVPVTYWAYAYYVYQEGGSYYLYSTRDGRTFGMVPHTGPMQSGYTLRP